MFVYDGDYWGYEFSDCGVAIDHYVQESIGDPIGFPGENCRGNANLVAQRLPFLKVTDVAPYLVLQHSDGFDLISDLNGPARPGDEYKRFDAFAAVDFLRLLGVGIETREGYVALTARSFRSLAVTRRRTGG